MSLPCKCMKKNRFLLLKPFDLPVIIFATALTLASFAYFYSDKSSSSQVIIQGPMNSWIFPLDTEEEIIVTGPTGETRVLINKGSAAIVSSSCKGLTCIARGELYKNGQWTACLPNRVFLLIEGKTEPREDIDAAVW